jgi:hypothetical protein
MRVRGSLIVAALLTGTAAFAAENQATTNRLQQPTPDAPTTNALNKPPGQQTTTGLADHSRKQPTTNNLQAPPQDPETGFQRRGER